MGYRFGFVLISIIALFTSCKKETPKEATTVIKVKEYKTNIPLEGVSVNLWTCWEEYQEGCIRLEIAGGCVTGANGECGVNTNALSTARGLDFTKDHYWTSSAPVLEPEAWAHISLKRVNNYPDTSACELSATSELKTTSEQFFSQRDSVVDFRLFGNEMNKIIWTVYTVRGVIGTFPDYIYVKDTIATGHIFLNPKKFETMAASIAY